VADPRPEEGLGLSGRRSLCRRLALEKIVLRETAEQFAFDPAWDAGAEAYDLTPGKMVTWRQNAPHRIENGPMLNVSLSIEFMTPPALMRANVIYANGVLRRRLGARPRVQNGFGPTALGKLAVARGAKALKLQRPPRPSPALSPRRPRMKAWRSGGFRAPAWRRPSRPQREDAAIRQGQQVSSGSCRPSRAGG
jgi:hypothetical protein